MVLQTGKACGETGLSLLRRRDGSDVSVAATASPVRETDGTLRGVILAFRDFTTYQHAQTEQAELKVRLEAANKAKDDFLTALSHELRTPLTPVLATLTSWEVRRDLPPGMMDEVEMLCRNVRLEARLIDDLLDLTRIARGQLTLHKENVDAHALLAATLEIFRQDLERRQVQFGLRMLASEPYVHADPTRLQQVFWNLLGNAAKFTPNGGRIEVVTTNETNHLLITFADSGKGMSPQTMADLFKPFERSAGRREDERVDGLGIGLTISRNLVLAHRGEIQAASSGLGLGSTFLVTLPTIPAPSAPKKETRRLSVGFPVPEGRRVLLLEDHLDTADVVARILRSLGYEVVVSHLVGEALEALRAGAFDLVLSDIGLPDGNGIEFIARAREFTDTPMIALTGYGMAEDVARYREAGFVNHLTKPLRLRQLEEALCEFEQSEVRRKMPFPAAGPGF
jgi:signal transduction histidine kinase/CheY-like chemotaxis protein